MDKKGLIILPFGKHKGEMMKDLPESYLKWCVDNNVLKGKKREYALNKLGITSPLKLKELDVETQSLVEFAKVLAIDTNQDLEERIDVRKPGWDGVWILNGVSVGPLFRCDIKGGKHIYTNKPPDVKRSEVDIEYPLDTKFDETYYIRTKHFTEFGEFKPVGKIKVCEGGGWYSFDEVYEYKGKYYS